MPLVTFAHGEAEIDRLVRALRDLVDKRGRPGADPPVGPHPPGRELRIPALAPGEVVTDAIVAYLEEIDANGAFVEGAAEQSLTRFRVVA